VPVAARYDDGGYSGGSMKRSAIERLLVDVKSGLIDVIVVYKIDRLTRSLADFSRIVDSSTLRARASSRLRRHLRPRLQWAGSPSTCY
jgi:DNA invertase Pin-like site-specific DNA recombinase